MLNNLSLKFCLLNAENLFLLFDQPLPKNYVKLEENQWQKLSTSVYENKSLFKTIHLANTLKNTNSDIIMLCEVGGLESLKNFNLLFLNNEYSPILIEGNSDRNIDVGFLIKKRAHFTLIYSLTKIEILIFYTHTKNNLSTKIIQLKSPVISFQEIVPNFACLNMMSINHF